MTYVSPTFMAKSFTCPTCSVYSHFSWAETKKDLFIIDSNNVYQSTGIFLAECFHCSAEMVWFATDNVTPRALFPLNSGVAPLPHLEMPEDVKRDYVEARDIANSSPRGASALLRLALQKLCVHLGEKGSNINSDIAELVKKGLPAKIQKALDIVRVTGNNAVHPGEMNIEDSPDVVQTLFDLVNLIVENRIAEPKRIDALYSALPEESRKAIERRDG